MVWCAARFPRAPATPPAEKKWNIFIYAQYTCLKTKEALPKKKKRWQRFSPRCLLRERWHLPPLVSRKRSRIEEGDVGGEHRARWSRRREQKRAHSTAPSSTLNYLSLSCQHSLERQVQVRVVSGPIRWCRATFFMILPLQKPKCRLQPLKVIIVSRLAVGNKRW
jgi:hypothetical protein